MPFLLAEILDFQGSAHLIGVGSLSKLNIKMAMCICREFWCSQTLAAPEVEKMLLNYLVPIRGNRTFPRDTVKKSAIAFNSRIA